MAGVACESQRSQRGDGFLMYYHVTPTANVPRIMSEGLIPQRGPRSKRMADHGIFLFEDMETMEDALSNWLGDEFEEDEPLTLLGVELPPDAKNRTDDSADYEIV